MDSQSFAALLTDFLNGIKLSGTNAAILLSDDLIFEKNIPFSDPGQQKKEMDDFFDLIPFIREHIKRKQIISNKGIYLLATNSSYFEAVEVILNNLACEVTEVVPIRVFGDYQSDMDLSKEDIKRILDDKEGFKMGNFLVDGYQTETSTRQTVRSEDGEEEAESGSAAEKDDKKQLVFLIISIFILISTAIFVVFWFGWVTNPLVKDEVKVRVKVGEPVATGLATPTIEVKESTAPVTSSVSAQLKKDQIKIQVLNGSGIIGEAGKISDQLIALGYKDITIGNNPEATSASQVQFKKSINTDVKAQILSDLRTVFSQIVEDVKKSTNFDLSVVVCKDIISAGNYLNP